MLLSKSIPQAFVCVGILATLSRWHFVQWPMFTTESLSEDVLPKEFTFSSLTANVEALESKMSKNESGIPFIPKTSQKDMQNFSLKPEKTSVSQQIAWINSLVTPFVPAFAKLPSMVQSWIRTLIFSFLIYFGLNFCWAYYIYECFGGDLFPKQNVPSWKDMFEQMWVSVWSLPLYSLLPTITEELVERGWTLSYASISDVGVPMYVALFVLYIAFVEFGVYWMHRGLHDIPAGYKYLHAIHHKYNKEHSMSPFAGLAFHPLDGILQALPYTLVLFIVPMHFLTHEILLFATAFWTTNIHDNLNARLPPVMGAGWHTIHHTTYKHNYGHYFIIMDWLFGTLVDPDEFAANEERRALKASSKNSLVTSNAVH